MASRGRATSMSFFVAFVISFKTIGYGDSAPYNPLNNKTLQPYGVSISGIRP